MLGPRSLQLDISGHCTKILAYPSLFICEPCSLVLCHCPWNYCNETVASPPRCTWLWPVSLCNIHGLSIDLGGDLILFQPCQNQYIFHQKNENYSQIPLTNEGTSPFCKTGKVTDMTSPPLVPNQQRFPWYSLRGRFPSITTCIIRWSISWSTCLPGICS